MGSNQYRTRWGSDLLVPQRDLGEDPAVRWTPDRVRCGDLWGSRCRVWVYPPSWTHGDHPSGPYLPHAEVVRHLAILAHPACPPQVLPQLAESSSLSVRARVAARPGCPPEALWRLADDPEAWVRGRVAFNPACPPPLLVRLAHDPDPEVRQMALANPSFPPQHRMLGQL